MRWSFKGYHCESGMLGQLVMSQIPQNPVLIERRLKSWKIEYNFKWNQPYFSRGLNSLNSDSGLIK